MKKLFCGMLGAILLAGMLLNAAACGEASAPDAGPDTAAPSTSAVDAGGTTGEAAAETALQFPDTNGIDCGGYAFNLLYFSNLLTHSWTDIPTDMNPTEETGDVLNDSVYRRNRTVEELLNLTISETPIKGGASVTSEVTKAVMAGDSTYDLVFQSIVEIMSMTTGGVLRDINKLGLKLDSPWYDQKSIGEMTISGKLFEIESDISFYDKLATIVTFFNKSIAENYNMEDFYQKVLDGEWTYDYMLKCAEQVSADVNGDGKMDQEDSWGISCQNDGSYYLLHASGLKVGEKAGDSLRFAANDEKFIGVLSDIAELMQSDLYYNSQFYGTNIAQNVGMFTADRDLFLIRPVQSLFLMRDMKADFGIIPMPKYFEDDPDYHSPTNIYPGIIMCVPVNAANEDFIAAAVEVLAAQSYLDVMPTLYDVVLDTKMTRDETSAQMLDLVYGSRVYDIGLIWNFGGFRTTIVAPKIENVASTIAALTDKAEAEIAELYDSMK